MNNLNETKKICNEIINENHVKAVTWDGIVPAVEYIYSHLYVPTSLGVRITKDIFEGSLSVNLNKNNEEILICMYPDGDYYAYNLSKNCPEDGECFEENMGWI